eukprot:m.10239 g.10239  ORF g.10239 m.10239 type:complete len:583 (+) comp3636_c1_seq1:59-1807(+)
MSDIMSMTVSARHFESETDQEEAEEEEEMEEEEAEELLVGKDWDALEVEEDRKRTQQKALWVLVGLLCLSLITAAVIAAQQAKNAASLSAAAANQQAAYMCGLGAGDLHPFTISKDLYKDIRGRVQDTFAKLHPGNNTLFFLQGANTQTHFFSDSELPFWQESNFRYVSGGYERPGAAWLVCAISYQANSTLPAMECFLFVDKPSLQDAIWNGKSLTLSELRAMYHVDHILWKDDFDAHIPNLIEFLGNISIVDTLDEVANLNVVLPNPLNKLTRRMSLLRSTLGEARGIKTAAELFLLEQAAEVGTIAHNYIMRTSRFAKSEYQVESAFVAANTACGLKQQSYLPIVGSGPRASTLHYNTNYEPIEADWLLVDAGGAYQGYGTDITRTWPPSGRFSPLQRTVYEIVLEAQVAGLDAFTYNNTWVNVTTAADHALLRGLMDANLVNGTFDELKGTNITRVFMPHSLGHHLGLDVHDFVPGGIGKCRPSEDPTEGFVCPGRLEVNMVVTCEPGVYFIPALLQQSYDHHILGKYLNQHEIQKYLDAGIGGVRIEDVVVVTEHGPNILSEGIPKTVTEIEKYING